MSYLIKLVVFSVCVTLFVFGWNFFIPQEYTTNKAYFIVAFFFAFSYFTHLSLMKALADENKNAFTMRFMGATGIKLFASLVIILVYGFVNKKELVPFAVLYLFLYFAFSAFETIILFKRLKSKQ